MSKAKSTALMCWLAALLAGAYAVAATAQVVFLDHPLDRVVLGIWGVAGVWLFAGLWCWRQARQGL